MLTGKVFTDNQLSYSVWSKEADEQKDSTCRDAHSITKAHLRRLRRMQTQNIIQRAAFEVVNLFRGQRDVA